MLVFSCFPTTLSLAKKGRQRLKLSGLLLRKHWLPWSPPPHSKCLLSVPRDLAVLTFVRLDAVRCVGCWPLEGQVPQPWMQVLVGAAGNPRAECFSVSTEVWWWVKCLLLAASASTFAGSFLHGGSPEIQPDTLASGG